MNDSFRKPLLLAILSATALGASIASAQEPTTATPTETPATPSQSASADVPAAPKAAQTVAIDDQKIEKFADAYVAVQTIQMESAKKLDSTAADPAEQQKTQAAVENDMIAAVERTGLKLDEFNGIVQSMSADADLRARVVAEIRERTGG